MINERNMRRLIWAFALFPLLVTLIVFGRLPEEIPMHWNVHGDIDAFYSKLPWAFSLPLLGIIFTALFPVLSKIDPKKENYQKFKSQFLIIQLTLILFLAIMQGVIISISLGATFFSVDTLVKLLVGILIIILGNIMPKFKHNYFVGIKTPWTIANETVWAKTHRHGGYVWFIIGFLISILAFIPGTASAVVYFVLILGAAFEPIIYSWLKFKQEAK